MSGNNLFGDQAPAEVTGADALSALVGEGKKYATVEELAKGAVNGQAHITKLEGEAVTLRDASQQSKSVDDILAALKAQKSDDGNQPPANQPPADTLTTEQIVANALADRDAGHAKTKAQANVASVMERLTAKLGDKAGDVYSRVGSELGISLDKLAETSPDAVMKLVTDGQQQQQGSHLPTGQQGHIDPNANLLTYAKIQEGYKAGKIKRADKLALENDMLTKLGDKFWN